MNKISLQDIANYAAVVVATVALYIGWDQARIGRNQQHADVFPVLQIRSQFTVKTLPNGESVKYLSLKAFNAGVGPAFVKSADWQINNHPIKTITDVKTILKPDLMKDFYFGQVNNFLLAAREESPMLELFLSNDLAHEDEIKQFLKSFYSMSMSLCYCSLYDRCWVSRANAASPMPEQVEQCPTDVQAREPD